MEKHTPRVIKFRARDMVEKRWIYGFLNGPFFDCSFHPDGLHGDEDGQDLEKLALHPWQQFTGLSDKNGKEIYEGDVVQNPGGFNYEIKFERGSFIPKYRGMPYWHEQFVVIGNIYGNPELLTSNV